MALLVDPAVQVLKKGEVGGEQVFDQTGVDVGDACPIRVTTRASSTTVR